MHITQGTWPDPPQDPPTERVFDTTLYAYQLQNPNRHFDTTLYAYLLQNPNSKIRRKNTLYHACMASHTPPTAKVPSIRVTDNAQQLQLLTTFNATLSI